MVRCKVVTSMVRLVLIVGLAATSILSLGFVTEKFQQPPVKEPGIILPLLQREYGAAQSQGPDLDNVKAAVDAYFKAQYESRVLMKPVDLGFVIDTTTPQGTDLYNYELGLLKYRLDCYEHTKTIISKYTYSPEYINVAISGGKASVVVRPRADIVYIDIPNETHELGNEEHTITLTKTDEGWKLTDDRYMTEVSMLYSRGTDFENLRSTPSSRFAQWERQQQLLETSVTDEFFSAPTGAYFEYNRSVAAQYAYKYTCDDHRNDTTTNYNLLFQHFNPNDCLNFVSQCIWAGFGGDEDNAASINNHDLPMVDNIAGATEWWCDSSQGSLTWVSIPDFTNMIDYNYHNYGIGVQGHEGSFSSLEPGDVVETHSPSLWHVYLIYRWTDTALNPGLRDYNEYWVCAHTANRRDDRLSDLFPDPTGILRFYWIMRYRCQ